MKDEALPHCGSDRERRGRAADAAAGPVLARPNFFRTCLPPRDVVDRATERLNPQRFRAICTVAYRSPPAQDCLSRRRSPVRIRLGVLGGLHVCPVGMFTFGADGRPVGWRAVVGVRGTAFWSCRVAGSGLGPGALVCGGSLPGWRAASAPLSVAIGGGLGRCGLDGEVVGGGAAVFAVFGWESVGGSSLVFGLAGGERVVDAEVAGDQGGRGE